MEVNLGIIHNISFPLIILSFAAAELCCRVTFSRSCSIQEQHLQKSFGIDDVFSLVLQELFYLLSIQSVDLML
jgi:hypothetical protein